MSIINTKPRADASSANTRGPACLRSSVALLLRFALPNPPIIEIKRAAPLRSAAHAALSLGGTLAWARRTAATRRLERAYARA